MNKDFLYTQAHYKSNLTSCLLILYSNCSANARRLILATSWLDPAFLSNLQASNVKNLSNYLDTIVAGADAFKPRVNYTMVSLDASYAFVYISTSDKSSYFFINSIIDKSNFTFMVFNTSQLRVDCNVNMTNTILGFRWINFTFVSNQSESKHLYFNMSQLYLQKLNSSISNGFLL